MKEAVPNAPAIAFAWWRTLTESDGPARGQRRADLARMRRASTPLEVMQEPAALRLIQRLPRDPNRVAALAGVLVFVRETEQRRVARAIGQSSLDDAQSALMSEGRFRRLLQVEDAGLMDAMRRLARMAKGTVNVHDLSAAILYWGDGVKKRWIFDYYNVLSSAESPQGAAMQATNTTT